MTATKGAARKLLERRERKKEEESYSVQILCSLNALGGALEIKLFA